MNAEPYPIRLVNCNPDDPMEELASFGRWWFDANNLRFDFSKVAARYLSIPELGDCDVESAFIHVDRVDAEVLMAEIGRLRIDGKSIDCTFRVLDVEHGLRWYRMVSSAASSARKSGVYAGALLDVTSLQHAAMRERFISASTQYLIGCQTQGEAITKIIRLVCESLGWDWGAYWSIDDSGRTRNLTCRYSWQNPACDLTAFSRDSHGIGIEQGAGLVGRIWSTGQADWAEDIAGDLGFLRRQSAKECGLHAGYGFPVTYVTDDGESHRPGIVEFFSRLPRQREAQLPALSAAIAALIAQTVQRLQHQEQIRQLRLSAAEMRHPSVMLQASMEAELCRALEEDEFFLEYQPVFDRFGERMVAAEALIRWRKPNGELVRPDQFIPVAEQSSLIRRISRWVVARACRDLAFLHSAGMRRLQVHVNMAASEFLDTNLPGDLATIAESHGVAASQVCLELTEGTAMKDADQVIPMLRHLRQVGFDISIDDFGMGYSSLSRLHQLPITSIKIDRSFVKGLPGSREDSALVRTILDLGRHMKVKVIAEGVETDAQLLFLRQFGCEYVQGFYLGRPQPLVELLRLHREGRAGAG